MTITRRPMIRVKTAPAVVAVVFGLLLAAGCGHRGATVPPVQSGVPTSTPTSVITLKVYVADSLRSSFKDIVRVFETGRPGTRFQLIFGSSSSLIDRIGHDEKPDVLAVSDPAMEEAATDGLVKRPVKFATNRLTIVVPTGNPKGIRSLDDLARPGLRVAACQEQLPCGQATSTVASSAGVHLSPASAEPSGKAVVARVADGTADAGLAYVTEAKEAGDKVAVVNFSEALVALETYSIAATTSSPNPDRAGQFADSINSDVIRRIVADAGFERP